jgi:hypothetical protein
LPDDIGISRKILAQAGYNKGYLFKLDYLKRKLTFYKITQERKSSKDFLKGEKVLAIVNFETRRLPNLPTIRVRIGNVDLLGSFDTGQYGLIQLDDQAEKVLEKNSLLVPIGNDGYDDPIVNVNNIVLDGKLKVNVKGISPCSLEQTAPFGKGMQINEASYICFGYRSIIVGLSLILLLTNYGMSATTAPMIIRSIFPCPLTCLLIMKI